MAARPDGSAPRVTASLDQLVDIETPEQVVFSYTIAGLGSRAAAALIDLLICVAVLVGGWVLTALIFVPLRRAGIHADVTGPWALALLILLQFGVLWGYYVLFEGLRDGQTPGKKRLGLRVVRDGGYSVTFGVSAVRNLVRVVDLQPGLCYAVGIISAAVSRTGKRIGDIVAGTIVVREQVTHVAPPGPSEGRATSGVAPIAHTSLLTDDEFALLEQYVARRQALDADRRQALAGLLVARFTARLPGFMGSGPAMLLELFERERDARARGVAARSDTGAQREQHAIVAQGAGRWNSFAALLAAAQRRGLRSMSEEEVSDFVGRYRQLTADLARLRTAARGREFDALFYLSRLVGGGHNLFYRERRLVARSVWEFLGVNVPREIRRSAGPIGLAAALLVGPAVISYTVVVNDPAAARTFIPPPMIDRAENGVRRARTGVGYIEDPQLFRPVMASAIIANNVQVTFGVFALGVTAGIGTAAMLVVNGISVGGILALYKTLGIASLILAFVAPHGVLELSAIAIAGGGGLLLAAAILLPGARTRRDALVENGRRAIRLIAASSMLLVVAGALEGLISPIPWWPLEWKAAVSLATAVLLAWYVTRGRGRGVAADV